MEVDLAISVTKVRNRADNLAHECIRHMNVFKETLYVITDRNMDTCRGGSGGLWGFETPLQKYIKEA